MITKFGSLWAGNVDMDNPGYQGTPANDRWLSDEELAGAASRRPKKSPSPRTAWATIPSGRRNTTSSGRATRSFPTC